MELAGESADPKCISVFAVYEGSPAQRAGVKQGDELLQVNGISAASIGLEKLWNLLRAGEGKKLRLRIKSGESEREITIELEPLPI